MATPVKLPRPADAPFVDAYAGHVEFALQLLVDTLGDGTASTVSIGSLGKMQPSAITAADGALAKSYGEHSDVVQKYHGDLDGLDKKIAEIATNSADVANTTQSTITALVDRVTTILDATPHKPSPAQQWAVIDSIDKAIGEADTTVTDAHDQFVAHAASTVTPAYLGDTVTSGAAPSSSFVPVDSSGGYDSSYTQQVQSVSGSTTRQVLSTYQLVGYIRAALDALHIDDPVARQRWIDGYLTLIQRESGGNVGAINLTDSNAVAGHPSQGLTQTIPSTFNEYHVAGTSNVITDPTANIAASMNYVMHTYHVSRDGANLASNVQQADPSRSPRGY
ncbi:transglycosylase SLT domain-containing protein [Nocardia stercoris]|uniref:Transglycosylase SLT domain-containing protein n=1 Tax=Nocardia stercoris TaxID=2483361 RepID=A0A3M2KVP0_9NOCA|nr:transglycosylase SLT domain-containing protein [Nocardia stercoris]RMI29539.1 hypothetical protein EBN03_26075 [Nocardia stercoris]